MQWSYRQDRHARDEVHALAKAVVAALADLIAYCRSCEQARFTPSDFPQADLSQAELDKFLSLMDPSQGGADL